MIKGIAPETPVPDSSFSLENSGVTESERRAEESATPPNTEEPDVVRSFPLENSGIVSRDLNARRSFPLENSGITGAEE